MVSHYLVVKADRTWEAIVDGHRLNPSRCQPLHGLPPTVSAESLQRLVDILDKATLCAGHPDDKFVRMMQSKKGRRLSTADGQTAAYLDENIVTLNGQQYPCTVRSATCEILCCGSKCQSCVSYRDRLHAALHRWQTRSTASPSRYTATSSRTNYRYLTTPEQHKRYTRIIRGRHVLILDNFINSTGYHRILGELLMMEPVYSFLPSTKERMFVVVPSRGISQ